MFSRSEATDEQIAKMPARVAVVATPITGMPERVELAPLEDGHPYYEAPVVMSIDGRNLLIELPALEYAVRSLRLHMK